MIKATYFSIFLIIIVNSACSQTIDDYFSQEKMLKDLEVFKNIRLEANSGLYKYRTKQEIDSTYNWASNTKYWQIFEFMKLSGGEWV